MAKRTASIAFLAFALIGLLLCWGPLSQESVAQHATPEAAAPVAITSEILGHAVPVPVEDAELSLGRVTVMPGAVLPVHYHPGTQIGVIVQGELTYSVHTGEILWYRGGDPLGEPETIGSGETIIALPGDALVESPQSIHQGRNNGSVPLVIYLSTLFPADAPRAIIVEATPGP